MKLFVTFTVLYSEFLKLFLNAVFSLYTINVDETPNIKNETIVNSIVNINLKGLILSEDNPILVALESGR